MLMTLAQAASSSFSPMGMASESSSESLVIPMLTITPPPAEIVETQTACPSSISARLALPNSSATFAAMQPTLAKIDVGFIQVNSSSK